MTRLPMIAVLCGLVSACNPPIRSGIQEARTDNPKVDAALIARIDGCDLYKIYEEGNRVYLSVCHGSASRTQWTESCGKSCRRYPELLSPIKMEDN